MLGSNWYLVPVKVLVNGIIAGATASCTADAQSSPMQSTAARSMEVLLDAEPRIVKLQTHVGEAFVPLFASAA